MPVNRTLFSGSPYLGVYLRIGDATALLPPTTPAALEREIARSFGVATVRTTVHDSEVVGAFVAMNSHGTVVGDEVDDLERTQLEQAAPLAVVRARHNAMGNNVLVNDFGALVHPEFSDDAVEHLGRALKVPAHRGTVAGLGTVGMAAIATNRGVVVHPKTTEKEAQLLESILKVPAHRSTANFGIPTVGACVAANSRALLVGRPTTPVEIAHLQEGLQIFD